MPDVGFVILVVVAQPKVAPLSCPEACGGAREGVGEPPMVVMSAFNARFARAALAHAQLSAATNNSTTAALAVYGCVDDEACAAVGGKGGARVLFMDLRKVAQKVEARVDNNTLCRGLRSIQVAKIRLFHFLLDCGCSVAMVDIDYLPKEEVFMLLSAFPMVDVLSAADFAFINIGRFIARSNPRTRAVAHAAAVGATVTWDQAAVNHAMLAMELSGAFTCCALDTRSFFTAFPVEKYLPGRRRLVPRRRCNLPVPKVRDHAPWCNSSACGVARRKGGRQLVTLRSLAASQHGPGRQRDGAEGPKAKRGIGVARRLVPR